MHGSPRHPSAQETLVSSLFFPKRQQTERGRKSKMRTNKENQPSLLTPILVFRTEIPLVNYSVVDLEGGGACGLL